jgi:hypothetical protein
MFNSPRKRGNVTVRMTWARYEGLWMVGVLYPGTCIEITG